MLYRNELLGEPFGEPLGVTVGDTFGDVFGDAFGEIQLNQEPFDELLGECPSCLSSKL